MSVALWEQSLVNKSHDEISTLAAVVPQSLMSLSTGTTSQVTRASGLILTKDQIISLRKYEVTALALPIHQRTLATYLNFGEYDDGGLGFKAENFLETFQKIHKHALLWSGLRSRIMLTGTDLKLFGSSMAVYLSSVEEILEDVKSAKALSQHNINNFEQLRAWEVKEGKSFPDLELEVDTIPDLGDVLDAIFEQVKRHLLTATQIKVDLDNFGRQLSTEVIPSIQLLNSALAKNTYAADIEMLNKEVSERAIQIDELHKEYKALVYKSLESVSSFSLIGLGVAIYIGVEAENIRSERNKLRDIQDEVIKRLASKSKTLGSIARVRADMQNMQSVALDAEVATKNLVHTWNVLHAYIGSSAHAVSKIEDGIRFRAFVTQFRLVAAPWEHIRSSADELVALFNEAEAQFMQEHGVPGEKQ